MYRLKGLKNMLNKVLLKLNMNYVKCTKIKKEKFKIIMMTLKAFKHELMEGIPNELPPAYELNPNLNHLELILYSSIT